MQANSIRNGVSMLLPDAAISISKSGRRLNLFSRGRQLLQFPVAIGKPHTPTPVGNFVISSKIVNPGGVLGTRWLGLFEAYGIHGTNSPWSIGRMISNGCVRMHNPNVEQLFALVSIGTPVYIRE